MADIILNIGSGNRAEQNQLNIDIHPIKDIDLIADAHHLPFTDGCANRVEAHCVLEHLENPYRALIEFRRVLNDGGEIRLTLPNPCEWRRTLGGLRGETYVEKGCDHKQCWDLAEMCNLLSQLDLQIVKRQFTERYRRRKHRMDWLLRRVLPPILFMPHTEYCLKKV